MSYRACRGVCIGVDRHLTAGDPVPGDMDADTLKFLGSIGAVAFVRDEANIPVQAEANTPDQDEPKSKKQKFNVKGWQP